MHGPTFAPTLPAPAPVAPTHAPRPRPQRPAAKPDPAAAGGGNLVLTYLRLHWMLILFAGSFAAMGLAYVAYSVIPVKYESTASLRVTSAPPSFTGGADPNKGQTAFATYMKTLRPLVKDYKVLLDAVNSEKHRLDKLDTIKAQPDPVKFLDEKLDVTSPEGSELIYIHLEGDKAGDVKKIVDAVQTAFLDHVKLRAADNLRRMKEQSDNLAARYLSDLRRQFGAVGSTSEYGGPSPASPPGVIQAGGALPAAVGQIAVDPSASAGPPVTVRQASVASAVIPASAVAWTETVESKRMDAQQLQGDIYKLKQLLAAFPVQLAEAQTLLDRREQEKRDAGPPAQPSERALAEAARHPDVLAKRAAQAQAEQAAGAFVNARQKDSPVIAAAGRQALAARVAADNELHTQAERIERDAYAPRVDQAAQLAVQAADLVRRLKAGHEQRTKELDANTARLAAIHLEIKEIKKAEETKAAVDLLQTEFMPRGRFVQSIIEQQLQLQVEALTPDRVQVQTEGSAPRMKDPKKQVMAALAAAAAGFALVGFGAVGYEFRARKVSSLAELRAGGPNVVGVVPFLPDAAAADPLKRADIAEAIDKLRATVAQEWLGRGTATILVTSPLADEGKALTAYRLATSLAQAGTRTLLVDFDLRTPTLHQFAGVENTHGVADILRGEADPRSGQILLPSGLAFLPAGAWDAPTTDDPAGLPPTLGAALDPLLHKLRADVDCLVVHGHSILTAADTVELARRSDAVLLCALYRETRMPLVKRAADRIAGMAGPAAGVVYIGATRHEALC